MAQNDVPPLPKLPLGETISLSYAWFFQKFADVLRISWLWLVLCAILIGSGSWLQFALMAEMFAGAARGPMRPDQLHLPHSAGVVLLLSAGWLAMTLGTISIAVAWHRRIILGEQPGLSGANIATKPLWGYIGVGISIALIALLPILVVMIPATVLLTPIQGATWKLPSGVTLVLVGLALYVVGVAIMLRLSVLLPARAAGDRSLTIGQAWRRTRGNTWRLFWGLIACSVPPAIAMEIIFLVAMTVVGISKLVPAPPSGSATVPALEIAIMNATFLALYLLIVPIYIGFLSHSYRHFFQGGVSPAE